MDAAGAHAAASTRVIATSARPIFPLVSGASGLNGTNPEPLSPNHDNPEPEALIGRAGASVTGGEIDPIFAGGQTNQSVRSSSAIPRGDRRLAIDPLVGP